MTLGPLRDWGLETSGLRAVLAILVGAAVGTTAMFVPCAILAGGTVTPEMWSLALVAYIVWIIGLVLIGGPLWAVLHHKGLRGWLAALVAGASAPGLFWIIVMTLGLGQGGGDVIRGSPNGLVYLFQDGHLTAAGLIDALVQGATLGAIGACVGLAGWFVAYRRVPQN